MHTVLCIISAYMPPRYRSLAEEYGPADGGHGSGILSSCSSSMGSGSGSSSTRGSQLAAAMAEEGTAANASLYVLLRACDRCGWGAVYVWGSLGAVLG
jgi:hypothetical protein